MAREKSEIAKRKLKWEIEAENTANRAVKASGFPDSYRGADRDKVWDDNYNYTLKRLAARHKLAVKRLKRIKKYKNSPLKGIGRSSMLGYD